MERPGAEGAESGIVIEARLGPARVVFTDRRGGVSESPYDTANLSTGAADDPAAVAENRRRLARELGLADPEAWWWLHQVHGADVVLADGPPEPDAGAADAAVTVRAALPLVVLTADCVPVALACDDAAGVAHAGWQGLLAGVIERAVAQLRDVGHGQVHAVLGPCIRPSRYEFGRDDLDRVVARLGPDVEAATSDGAPALDMPAAVRLALRGAGVSEVDDVGVCTAASPEHFSHRRDGETGRQGTVVVLEP